MSGPRYAPPSQPSAPEVAVVYERPMIVRRERIAALLALPSNADTSVSFSDVDRKEHIRPVVW